MLEYIKKFETAEAADQYAISAIPFMTSVATDPVQNLVCNEEGRKLLNASGIIILSPEMVDLGLPSGTLWSKYNFGVKPAELNIADDWYGWYYAWAELETKTVYNWETYTRHTNGIYNQLTNHNVFIKYCSTSKESYYWGGEGAADNKLVIEPEDDIVTQTYGSDYCIPTISDLDELVQYTDREWLTNYNGITGLNGVKMMKKTDHSVYIFVPATGGTTGGDNTPVIPGQLCTLVSSTLNTYYGPYAYDTLNMWYAEDGVGHVSIMGTSPSRCDANPIRLIQRI